MHAREAFLAAADSAVGLLRDAAVESRWAEPSALVGFSVGGLAAHLGAQIIFVPRTLAEPAPEGEPLTLMQHYARVRWIGADLDDDVNVQIRRGGEDAATVGPIAVLADVEASVRELAMSLPKQPADRVVHPPAGAWPIRLDDFLVTRMMEIAVHSDDLAFSVGVPAPDLPASVLDPVLALLTSLAVRRHGQPAVIRVLSRAERAPRSISAF